MTEAALFIAKHWKLILGGLALATLGFMLMLAKADARHWHKMADAEKAAHAQTVANYRAAAVQADLADKANVLRVKDEQAAITERITDEYQGKLASATDRYERLRTSAEAYLRSPSVASVPDTREATCHAVAGTGCEAIPPLLRAAQDNTDQLIALQSWAKQQAEVRTNLAEKAESASK